MFFYKKKVIYKFNQLFSIASRTFLIAIGITASRADPRATKKQIKSGMKELDITKEEIMDVLKIVLLTSGMPAFSKAVQILNSVIETQ